MVLIFRMTKQGEMGGTNKRIFSKGIEAFRHPYLELSCCGDAVRFFFVMKSN
jgi:hypothetical protein